MLADLSGDVQVILVPVSESRRPCGKLDRKRFPKYSGKEISPHMHGHEVSLALLRSVWPRSIRALQKKLTIQDIARLAGVSKATVSRVLNRNPSVDPTLSERVMQIVQQYDFVPNITATGLAGGRTRLIGVLAPPLTWPGVPEIIRGVAAYIEDQAYEIVLYSINVERNHTDILDRILSMRMVEGMIAILPGALSRHLMARFHHGLPMVMIDDQEKPADIPWVGIDNVASAYDATKYLLDAGHRRIAHILGPQHYYCALERYQGFCRALQEAGIAPNPALLPQGDFETSSGRQCATLLFSRERSEWPTAIFAANDQMAYGVLEVAEERGIRVPDDVAVIGFDDNVLSAYMRPPLSTVHQPFTEMGSKAIEILLGTIDTNHRGEQSPQEPLTSPPELGAGNAPHAPIRIQLPTHLVIRASTKRV